MVSQKPLDVILDVSDDFMILGHFLCFAGYINGETKC